MRLGTTVLIALLLVGLSLTAPPDASAMPAFSRMFGQTCSACHTTFPQLNRAGEEFRLSGYTRYEGGTAVPKVPPVTVGKLSLPGIVPLSVIGTLGFDYHKVTERAREDGRKTTVDPNSFNLEEIEIMAAAPLNRHLSFILDFPLAETEFEDKEFKLEGPGVPELAAVSFNNLFVDDLINLRVGVYELPVGLSPKQRRITIAPYEIYEATAQRLLGLEEPGARGIEDEGEIFSLATNQLMLELYGTAYSERLGVSNLLLRYHIGTANDSNVNADNNGDKSVFGRIAVDYLDQSVGFFGFWSPNTLDRNRPEGFPGKSNESVRFGPNLHLRFFDERLNVLVQYLWGRDTDPTGTGRAFEFSGGFVEASFIIRGGGWGMWVPVVRFDYVQGDSFDNTEGAESLGLEPVRTKPRVWAVTGGLQYLPWENVKIMAEVTYRETEDRLGRSSSTVENDRVQETLISLQVMVAF